MSSKEWPLSVLIEIDEEVSFNAPLRSISVLIPSHDIRFGMDCITLHNAILKKIYKKELKLGSKIVGTGDSTHSSLQKFSNIRLENCM